MHSPFHITEDFISPLQCETLVQTLALKRPDHDDKGHALKHTRVVPLEHAGNILSHLDGLTPLIERRYGGTISGEPAISFHQYFENPKIPAEQHGCEAYKYVRKKWTKVKDVDLVGFLWLKSFHNSIPLDSRFEVYGGKLEFPGYNFSLTPVRGTLAIFPGTPHFVTAMSHVLVGSLELIKINIKLTRQGAAWTYDPAGYPGTYEDWFKS